jgi:glycosyltransferase involved in cell wall biosynthesis
MWLYTATGAGAARLVSYLSFTATGFVGAVSSRRPDVVFVESPPLFLGVAGLLAARRFDSRLVLNISDLWPDSVRDLGLLAEGRSLRAAEWLEQWLYRRADLLTAVTEGIRTRLILAKGVSEDDVLFLPNGVDLDLFRPLQPTVNSNSGRPVVLYTGNHGYAQSLEVILQAASLAREIDFVMVGSGSDKGRLEGLAGDMGLRNVRFLPPVPPAEISSLYANAMAGVASLRGSELMDGARPAKLLAIMSCAKPVIYSGRGEGADLVRISKCGIVTAPEDPEALANAARTLAKDPATSAAMGASGRRYVEEHLSWASVVSSWLDELHDRADRRWQL